MPRPKVLSQVCHGCPVVITAFADKSFTFIIKTPPATTLIKKAIKLEKVLPLKTKVGKITHANSSKRSPRPR